MTASPDGRFLAVSQADAIMILTTDGSTKHSVVMPDVNELEWGSRLIAGAGAELWNIPLDGSAPQKLPAAGNRQAGFSLHPDGERIAVTAGRLTSEVRILKLGGK